jgi:hypothetical protein
VVEDKSSACCRVRVGPGGLHENQRASSSPYGRARLTAGVGRDESDHELARKRPILAGDVPEIAHLHADLFADLAPGGRFQRFADVHESRYQTVPALGPEGLPRQENPIAVSDQDDHGRVKVRIVVIFAAETPLSALALDGHGRPPAAGAMPAGRLPVRPAARPQSEKQIVA